MIAGHTFDRASGLCTCGRKFSDISGAQFENVGKEHWAHSGGLTQNEFDQIVAERERLWRALTGAPKVEAPAIGPTDDFSG